MNSVKLLGAPVLQNTSGRLFLDFTIKIKKSKKITANLTNSYFIFQQRFGRVSSIHFQTLLMKKLRYKYFNKLIRTCDNGNGQSHHDQEESSSNSTINLNSGAHCTKNEEIINGKIHFLFNVCTI